MISFASAPPGSSTGTYPAAPVIVACTSQAPRLPSRIAKWYRLAESGLTATDNGAPTLSVFTDSGFTSR